MLNSYIDHAANFVAKILYINYILLVNTSRSSKSCIIKRITL